MVMVHRYCTSYREMQKYLHSYHYNPPIDVYMDIVLGLVYMGGSTIPNRMLEDEDLPEDKKEILAEQILLAGPEKDQMKQDIIQKQKLDQLKDKDLGDRDAQFGRIIDGDIQLLQGGKRSDPELQEWLEQLELIKMSEDPLEILQIDDYPEEILGEEEFEILAKMVKKRGRQLSRKYHPDKGGSVAVQQKINQAAEIYTDYEKYLSYRYNDEPGRSIFTYADADQAFTEAGNMLARVLRRHSDAIMAKTSSRAVMNAMEVAQSSVEAGSVTVIPLMDYIKDNAPKVNRRGEVAKSTAEGVPTCKAYVPMTGFSSGLPPAFTDAHGHVDEEDGGKFKTLEQEIEDLMAAVELGDEGYIGGT